MKPFNREEVSARRKSKDSGRRRVTSSSRDSGRRGSSSRDSGRRRVTSSSRDSGRREGSGRRPSFSREGTRGRFEKRDTKRSSRMEMHEVICDKCGKECEVPFKPTSSKPIFCSDCFKKEDGRSTGNSSIDLTEINEKLDKIMKALKIKD